MKNLIRKILKEEVTDAEEFAPFISDRQQKLYDYAVKDILDNIEIIPNYVTYENIDTMMDDPLMESVIEGIMNNWRQMDARGWRVGDADTDNDAEGSGDMIFSKKSDPSRFMDVYGAEEEIALEVMEELVDAGKFRRISPEENEGFGRPDGTGHEGWQSLYQDYEVKTPNISLDMSFPLWYHPFGDYYYPYGIDEGSFRLAIIRYLEEMYGITRNESFKLFDIIKKGIRDRLSEEGINVNYDFSSKQGYYDRENVWGRALNEGVIDDFVNFTKNKLGLDDFTVELEGDGDDLETLASYDMGDNKVKVLSKNRATPDIIRSIAHELVHHKQNQKGELTGDKEEGEDGAPLENEANSLAGYLVRQFGKLYPEIYDL